MTEIETLDCGHPPSEHADVDAGYGTGPDGKRRCYDCCAEFDRAAARAGQPILAYLGTPKGDVIPVHTWPGRALGTAHLVSSYPVRNSGYGTAMWCVRAHIENRWFSGRGFGPGMSIHLRPLKRAKSPGSPGRLTIRKL